MIPITKPFLPPQTEYLKYINGIWNRNWLTNNGPLVKKLEVKLKGYLNVSHLLFLGNGTIALQIAIKALKLKGEIITTPFSYVASTSSIVWENCTPVFADIDPETLNIDPEEIEKAISPNTTAILATHVFGNPCDVLAIQKIADRHQLKIIYDAAHAFNVKLNGKSILTFGDLSTCSFHATKVFQTIEGGAIVTADKDLALKTSRLRNFGHAGPSNFDGIGINGKNSEFHAAMGLAILPYIDEIIKRRRELVAYYDIQLANKNVRRQKLFCKREDYNFAYYPVIFPNESSLISTVAKLNTKDIYPRRYFHPSLNTLDYVNKSKSIHSEGIAKTILCLPLYHELTYQDIDLVCECLESV